MGFTDSQGTLPQHMNCNFKSSGSINSEENYLLGHPENQPTFRTNISPTFLGLNKPREDASVEASDKHMSLTHQRMKVTLPHFIPGTDENHDLWAHYRGKYFAI
jgi:hypothetical protein